MSMPCASSAGTMKASASRDSRLAYRRLVIVGGSLAVVGAALSLLVDPVWSGLAVLGGIALILLPDRHCCGR